MYILNENDIKDNDIIIEVFKGDRSIGYILYSYITDKIRYEYNNTVKFAINRPPILISDDGSCGLESLYDLAIYETYPPQRPHLVDFCKVNGLDYYDPLLLLYKTKGKRITNNMTYKFIKFKFKENKLFPSINKFN